MHDPTSVFSLCCAVLAIAFAVVSTLTAVTRARRNIYLNGEDAPRTHGAVAEVEHPDVARILRVHRNLLENSVPFFVLGALWLGLAIAPRVAPYLFVVFTASRLAHIAFYLSKRGGPRTVAHAIGFLLVLVLAIGVIHHTVAS